VTNRLKLKELINTLQQGIKNKQINRDQINNAITELSNLGYKYDDKKFPALKNSESFTDASVDTPLNLAEALLWKLGKWQTYKKFTANFTNDAAEAKKTDVVFFAFAKHLKDKENPIYDQHAIRALWAIDIFTNEEKSKCKSLLFDSKNKWKTTGSGTETINCYNLFISHINTLVSNSGEISKKEIDRLLMPLGQAIKKETNDYLDFKSLCGWSTS
jgi:hypothetical protein